LPKYSEFTAKLSFWLKMLSAIGLAGLDSWPVWIGRGRCTTHRVSPHRSAKPCFTGLHQARNPVCANPHGSNVLQCDYGEGMVVR
jgi:hypothetical protein